MPRNAAESPLVIGKILALLKPAFGETRAATNANKARLTTETPKYLFTAFMLLATNYKTYHPKQNKIACSYSTCLEKFNALEHSLKLFSYLHIQKSGKGYGVI